MHVYFMGICGSAMGNAAILMKALGHCVSGSDAGVYPPMSDQLATAGIDVLEGFDAKRLATLAPDLVVVGNALTRGNPEVEWLLDTSALPYTSLASLIGEHAIGKRNAIVVTGTHGKTTTTCLAAYLLRAHGADPGYIIGGVPRDLPGGAASGSPAAPFVIEGDEYDTAFFDKRSKFIHYRPRIAILGNLEFDHADIFRDLEDIKRTFRHFLRLLPRSGYVVANGDDPEVADLLDLPWTRVIRVGTGDVCDVRLDRFREDPGGSRFELTWRGETTAVTTQLPGLYNARNIAHAAVAASLAANPGAQSLIDLSSLSRFQGVARRQEIIGAFGRVTIVEDFGHHPSAIRATLASFRARYPNERLAAIFEPRSNTACRKVLEHAFEDALATADLCAIAPIHRPEKYTDDDRFDRDGVTARLCQRGTPACPFPFEGDPLAFLGAWLDPSVPTRVVIFSNGSLGGQLARLKVALSAS